MWKAVRVSYLYSGLTFLNQYAVNIVSSHWPIDLNNWNMLNQWLHTCCDVLWHPKSNCKLIRFDLHDWNNFILINDCEVQRAPCCCKALQWSHNHQMVRKCTEHGDLSAQSWPCVFVMWVQMIPYSINQNCSPCSILGEWKKMTSWHSCVYCACFNGGDHSMRHHLAFDALLANSLLNLRDITRCSSRWKISSWYILQNIGPLMLLF